MVDELERTILKKLQDGLLDGIVGDDFTTGNYKKITIRKFIKDGIPQILHIGDSSKFFNGKENVRISGSKSSQIFKTTEEKLAFFQKYGWLINDPDVKQYSSLFKPKK